MARTKRAHARARLYNGIIRVSPKRRPMLPNSTIAELRRKTRSSTAKEEAYAYCDYNFEANEPNLDTVEEKRRIAVCSSCIIFVLRFGVTWQRASAAVPFKPIRATEAKHVTAITKVQGREGSPSSWKRGEGGTPLFTRSLFLVRPRCRLCAPRILACRSKLVQNRFWSF